MWALTAAVTVHVKIHTRNCKSSKLCTEALIASNLEPRRQAAKLFRGRPPRERVSQPVDPISMLLSRRLIFAL